MQDYRAYIIGPQGRIQKAIDWECVDDTDALRRAGEQAQESPVEVWQRARLVGRVDPRSDRAEG